MQNLTTQTIQDMRAWCADVFEDMPHDATNTEVISCVSNQYAGGIAQFERDNA